MNKVFLAALMAVFLVAGAQAAPGGLDTTFGSGNGWTSTGFELAPTLDTAFSLIQQTDGKLVVAGVGKDDMALVRYDINGSLDITFNGTGKLTTAIGTSTDAAQSVIQQADGKLVVAGYSNNGNYYDVALVRYNSDGSLDSTFNGTGKLTTAIGGADDVANSVIQQADGKLVAAGYSHNGSNKDFALVRYNSDGSLDTSFHGTGKLTTAIGGADDYANSVIQQADGKLVVAGSSNNGSNYDFAMVRYNSDGSLDTSFNGTGKLTTAIGTSNDYGGSVVQQVDGKLVQAGNIVSSTSFGAPTHIGLARYNSNGSLDTTFSGDGKLITNFGTESAYSVIQQADGKLVAAGRKSKGGNLNDFELVRYNSDGSLDTGFNGSGELTIAVSANSNAAYQLIQQADGKLVAAGYSNGRAGFLSGDFALVRCNTDGSPDTTFSDDGMLSTGFFTSYDGASSLIQQMDGKLVVAGNAGYGSSGYKDFALLRYHTNGELDTTFSDDGKLTTKIGTYDYSYSVIQQMDGKLVVAGYSRIGTTDDFALVRYNSDGSLDTTFDTDGIVTTALGTGTDRAYSVIQQADGKLVVAGYSRIGTTEDFALVRYNDDGSLDTTFDTDGQVTTAIGTETDQAHSVIQQSDGKLVVAGNAGGSGGYTNFALVRYNIDGSLDATFSGDGKLTTDIGIEYYDDSHSVVQQADGKLVVAGYSRIGTTDDFVLMRYNGDGSLDTTFGMDGKIITAIGTGTDQAYSVIQQADGKLVVAGSSNNGSNNNFALVRYNPDGTLDTTLNGTGKRTLAFGAFDSGANAVIQQLDGKLVVAGYSTGMPTGMEFVVARFESGQLDVDSDGYLDGLDNCTSITNPDQLNIDGDVFGDACDAFSSDPTEWLDTDGDGIGNNADTDDDGDGVLDINDALPLDASESVDTDSDGIGNNSDPTPWGTTDSDHDTLPDLWEQANGHDPLKADYMVSAGVYHSCALDNDGVKCWGNNSFGQSTVPALNAPSMVSAGYRHTCAIDAAGVKCWGKGVENTGTLDNFGQSIPPTLNNPTMVSAGYWHTCAIDADGVHCWGKNNKGQTNVPVLNNPLQVAAGRDYSCALDKGVSGETSVKCWGVNGAGQTNVPTLVNPQSISLSVNHACAVDQNGVVCWGKNNAGQLNVPALSSPQLSAVGNTYSCALDSGSVVCWGDPALNTVGQTTVPSLNNPVSLDAGLAHTCALDSTGVKCWGRKAYAKVPVLNFTHP